jgi:hypothetical protein
MTNAFQFSPSALSIRSLQPCNIMDFAADGNRFHILNLAGKLKDYHELMMHPFILRLQDSQTMRELGGLDGNRVVTYSPYAFGSQCHMPDKSAGCSQAYILSSLPTDQVHCSSAATL